MQDDEYIYLIFCLWKAFEKNNEEFKNVWRMRMKFTRTLKTVIDIIRWNNAEIYLWVCSSYNWRMLKTHNPTFNSGSSEQILIYELDYQFENKRNVTIDLEI